MDKKYDISDFAGSYHSMPDAVMNIVSGDAYMVFSRIYACGCKTYKEAITDKPIFISIKNLCYLTGMGNRKVSACIKELVALDLLKVEEGDGSRKNAYTINWGEIDYIRVVTANINYEGIAMLREMCYHNGVLTPFSKIDVDTRVDIISKFAFKNKENAETTPQIPIVMQNDTINSICDVETAPQIQQHAEMASQNKFVMQNDITNFADSAEMTPQTKFVMSKCTTNQFCDAKRHHKIIEKDGELVLYVFLNHEESIINRKIGIDKVEFIEFCDVETAPQTKFVMQNDTTNLKTCRNDITNPVCDAVCDVCDVISAHCPQKTCKNNTTVNIYNKINKNNKQYERSEYCNIGEELNKTNFLEENLEKDRENFLGEDLGLLKENNQEPSSSSEENIETTHSEAYFQLMKRKANTPFFSQVEIESFVDNIENCLDRPDKIFINRVWSIAKELLVSEWQDEDGKLIEEQIDPEGSVVYQDRLFPDILQPAMEETLEIIEKGYYELNGEKLPVECDNIDPDDIDIIIDFEITHQSDDNYYTLSKYRFRDIYSQLAEKKKKGRTRTEKQAARQQDLDYMKKIILIGDDDKANNTSQLTRPEKAVYCFMDHYAKDIWDDGSFEFDEGEYINRRELNMFFYEISQFGISEQEFLQLVYNRSMQKDTGALMMRERMFDSSAIKRMNAILSEHSIVDDYKI